MRYQTATANAIAPMRFKINPARNTFFRTLLAIPIESDASSRGLPNAGDVPSVDCGPSIRERRHVAFQTIFPEQAEQASPRRTRRAFGHILGTDLKEDAPLLK